MPMTSIDAVPPRSTVLIATGAPDGAWERVLPALRQVGLEALDAAFGDWHDSVLADVQADDWHAHPIAPSEEAASRAGAFFAEDGERPRFGADRRSLALLEFWAQTSPNAGFLLVYTQAETAVAHALANGKDPGVVLERWQVANRRLLLFQRRNRRRSVLIDAEAAARNLPALSKALARLGIALDPPNPAVVPHENASLERLIARELLANQLAVGELEAELEASALPLGAEPPRVAPSVAELVNSYLAQRAAAVSLADADRRREALQKDNEVLRQRGEELKSTAEAAEEAARQSREENELLLLQLHQVQEELETRFLQQQSATEAADQTIADLKQQTGKYRAAAEVAEKANADLKRQLEQQKSAAQAPERLAKELREENELLLLQLHQVQEELEKQFLEHQETKQSLNDRAKEIARSQAATGEPQTRKAILSMRRVNSALTQSPSVAQHSANERLNWAQRRQLKRDTRLVKQSGLFDATWYLAEYPDVAAAGIDPVRHYLRHGVPDGRDPSPEFSTGGYLRAYPDVDESGINPLVHYIKFGKEEGRLPKGR